MKQKGAQTTPAQQEINQDITPAPLEVARRAICDIMLSIRENEGICSQRNASG
jgi:hypothetical protein